MISIIDTYPQIDLLLQTDNFDYAAWCSYIDGVSPALRKMITEDSANYDFEQEIMPVLRRLYMHKDDARRAHEAFLNAVNPLANRMEAHGVQVDCTVILYLGLCNGAGWATELDGQAVVLLGLEKVVELGWIDDGAMVALVYHEIGHLWHFQNRREPFSRFETAHPALAQLYSEGVAMYFEHRMCGERIFHQDRDGWLSWCDTHKKLLALEYTARLEQGKSVQDFFGDWCSFMGHSDTGYYLGNEVVRIIASELGEEMLLNADAEMIAQYLRKV